MKKNKDCLRILKNISYLCIMKPLAKDTRNLRRMIAIAASISIGLVSQGQEMIRQSIDFFNCDSSIVRQFTKNIAYVYNRTYRTSSFMKVTEGVTVCPSIYIEPLYMNDFELLSDTAVFCGYIIEEDRKKGIVGFFRLSGFPGVNVYYKVIDECTELIKLDIYSVYDVFVDPRRNVHIVATGTTTGARTDVLLDMTPFGNSANNCEIHFADGPDEYYDDVAATMDFVVVSTRDVETDGTPVVNLWEYVRPSAPGLSIFNTGVSRKRITSPVADSPVLLESTVNNEYSAVYKNIGYSRITVLKTIAGVTAPVDAVDLLWLKETVVPRDIKWDWWHKDFDVLTFGHPEDEFRTRIYHLPPAVFDGTATGGLGTRYSYTMLWSIDPCRYPYRDFVVSGSLGQQPRLCRYYYNHTDACPDGFVYIYDIGKLQYNYKDEALPYIHWRSIPGNKWEPRQVDIPFPYECGKPIE